MVQIRRPCTVRVRIWPRYDGFYDWINSIFDKICQSNFLMEYNLRQLVFMELSLSKIVLFAVFFDFSDCFCHRSLTAKLEELTNVYLSYLFLLIASTHLSK